MQQSIKVALLGHNSIVREGLRHILADENFRITQSVDNSGELADDSDDDLLIVVDADAGANDSASIRALHRRFPAVKLVVLSDMFEFDAMTSAFRAGADGYMVKEISCEPLVASLRLVMMGEKVMPSDLVEALSHYHDGHERDDARSLLERANLSPREREILSCLIMGCPNKVISRRLSIAEATVKVHIKAILRKLRVQNRTQAAIRGVNGGLEHHLGAPPVLVADAAPLSHDEYVHADLPVRTATGGTR